MKFWGALLRRENRNESQHGQGTRKNRKPFRWGPSNPLRQATRRSERMWRPPVRGPRTRVPRLWLLQLSPDPVHAFPLREPLSGGRCHMSIMVAGIACRSSAIRPLNSTISLAIEILIGIEAETSCEPPIRLTLRRNRLRIALLRRPLGCDCWCEWLNDCSVSSPDI